jgi:endonuclease/exonuclease/phosphatase family metal-dependent hydrolase
MSYNVCEGRKGNLADYIFSHKPDILCLQEIATNTDHWARLTEQYNSTYDKFPYSSNQILSKHKIIRKGEIDGLHPMNGVWADLKVKNDTVRVVSLHLQSTAIRPEDTQFLERHKYILDKERETKLRSIVERLVENNCKRAEQAERVAEFLDNTPYQTIVCGDFNDVPLSYTYNRIAKHLEDTFSKMAEGFTYTYNTRYRLLRIDNILVSPSVEVVSYEVDNEVELSDHYPVISRVKFSEK